VPPYCPYLATSNISPNKKVNTNYNRQCSEKELFATSGWQIWQIDTVDYPATSWSEWRQVRLGCGKSPSLWGIGKLELQKESHDKETLRNPRPKQWRERPMDWGLCWGKNHWGKQASWRRRGSGSTRVGWYEACWNCGIDEQRAQRLYWGDEGCFWRQSEWSCKFRWWGGWWRWGWWTDRAGQAERSWRTWLGDGHNHQKVQQRMQRFRQEQMKLDELTQPGWDDAADYIREIDKKYSTSELRVPAVVQPQTDDDAAAPAPTTFGELMECLEIVPGRSQMLQGTSWPGSRHIRLGLVKPQLKTSISGL